jgi:hypothetical protein
VRDAKADPPAGLIRRTVAAGCDEAAKGNLTVRHVQKQLGSALPESARHYLKQSGAA